MSNRVIDEYEVLYRETRNPLFVWEAIQHCARDQPLPEWIFDYMVGAARSLAGLGQPAWDDVPRDQIETRHDGLLDLADRVRTGEMEADAAAKLVPRALGLKRGAKGNAYAERKQIDQEFAEAWYIDVTSRGSKQEVARFNLEKRGASRSQINRRVARARALWAAQRVTKE